MGHGSKLTNSQGKQELELSTFKQWQIFVAASVKQMIFLSVRELEGLTRHLMTGRAGNVSLQGQPLTAYCSRNLIGSYS